MNCFLVADKMGVPFVLVILALVVLAFGGTRRFKYRNETCRPSSGWSFLPWIVFALMAGWLFQERHESTNDEMVNDAGRTQVKATKGSRGPQGNKVTAVTSQSRDVKEGPFPELVDWASIAEAQAAAAQQIALATAAAAAGVKTDALPKTDAVPKTDAKRPTWVDAAPGKVGGSYRTKASSGPWSTDEECQKALNEELRRVVGKYLEDLRSDGVEAGTNIPLSYINQHIVKETYRELVDSPSVGPMYQVHALLEFSPQTQQELEDRFRSSVIQRRLERTATGMAALFAMLGSLFGVLKLDTFLQGKHRWLLGGGLVMAWLLLFSVLLGLG